LDGFYDFEKRQLTLKENKRKISGNKAILVAGVPFQGKNGVCDRELTI
jgi:hypothetical protein